MGHDATDLRLVARYGDPVNLPGFQNIRWGSLNVAANDADQALFGGHLITSGGGQTQALFGYDPSLGVVTLAKAGDAVEVEPGVTKTIASFTVGGDDFIFPFNSTRTGRGAALNDAGEVAYRAVFTDNSQAVLVTRIPVAGDATFDGILNIADFNVIYANFGKTFPGGNRSKGDFNLDGGVDFGDFQMLERNFGYAPPGMSAGVAPADSARLGEFARSVPEPGTLAFITLTAACGLARRRMR
jgi:hypothetical protein